MVLLATEQTGALLKARSNTTPRLASFSMLGIMAPAGSYKRMKCLELSSVTNQTILGCSGCALHDKTIWKTKRMIRLTYSVCFISNNSHSIGIRGEYIAHIIKKRSHGFKSLNNLFQKAISHGFFITESTYQ